MVYFEIQNWLAKNKSRIKTEIFQRIYTDQDIGVVDENIFDMPSAQPYRNCRFRLPQPRRTGIGGWGRTSSVGWYSFCVGLEGGSGSIFL
jgi:hypothetical protein